MGKDKRKNSDIESQEDEINRDINITNLKEWTKEIAINLSSIAHKAAGFSWMYATDAAHFNNLNNNLTISTSILSTICAVGIASALVFIQTEFPGSVVLFYIFSILSIALNLTSACICSYKLSMNFSNLISQALDKAAKFGALKRHIETQFSLSAESRDPPDVLTRYVKERFDELEREKPFLRGSTTAEWKKHLTEMGNETEPNLIQLPLEFRQQQRDLLHENHKYDKIGQHIKAMM